MNCVSKRFLSRVILYAVVAALAITILLQGQIWSEKLLIWNIREGARGTETTRRKTSMVLGCGLTSCLLISYSLLNYSGLELLIQRKSVVERWDSLDFNEKEGSAARSVMLLRIWVAANTVWSIIRRISC
jgi:hypothetical protein